MLLANTLHTYVLFHTDLVIFEIEYPRKEFHGEKCFRAKILQNIVLRKCTRRRKAFRAELSRQSLQRNFFQRVLYKKRNFLSGFVFLHV